MTVEAVCFDLDDTLYDYHEYARAGLRAAADLVEARTGESFHDELRRLYFDAGVTEGTFDQLVARRDLPPALVDELVEAFHGATTPLPPYEETEEVLSRLRDDYDIGVVTDGRGGRAKLQRLGLDEYIDAVVVTPELGCSKREPRPFETALEDLDASARTAIYVGDDPRVDFRVPNALGLGTVRLRQGRYADVEPQSAAATPDVAVSHLGGILGLLGRGIGQRRR